MFILVAYDVPAKRTVIFHKILARYLMHMQNSVFAGDIKESECKRLTAELRDALVDEDRIMLLSCENRRNIDIQIVENSQAAPSEAHKVGLVL